jgi:hypothetical protein
VKLAGLSHLQTLSLAGTLVDGSGLAKLRALTELRDLDLSGSHVTNEGFESIALLTGLRGLRLRYLDINDTALNRFTNLNKI